MATELLPTVAVELAGDGRKIYQNEQFGYRFQYPVDANIIANDDPLKGLSIIGPVTGTDRWPQISISHPSARENYRPPAGTDLEKWLTEHNLVGDERLPDLLLAGTIAIHFRHDRSPQSYAYDRYYFAKSEQLYMVLIGHSGEKEDRELYNHFLESIQFAQ